MINKLLRWHHDQKGITGLETAIILIAFVVVAAVFAYTVLSAGLFSTQKSQEAVYSGLKEASNTLETRGSLIAYKGDANIDSSVGKVEFVVSLSSNKGTGSVDLTPPYTLVADALTLDTLNTPTQIAYADENVTLSRTAWTLDWVGKRSSDNILEVGEQAVITVWLHTYDGAVWADGTTANGFIAANMVDTYHTFNFEVKTPSGAVLTLERTTPAILDTVMDLH